ncbi:MAG TPA: protein kinase [Kofleriaceae bacterium]|nr:protein kinase [Kofleriaceae bacterium]
MGIESSAEKAIERLTGEVLANRYQIESKIGEGAMGAVYRAKHVKVGRAFAVKVLHPRLLEDLKTTQRFEREAELAGRLRHPNVIGVVDVGETPDGMRYMVMDFAAGPDLATLLNEAPFPPQRIIHLVRQLLEGLYHAHESGLIHRDFKPENVIVEKDTHGSEVPRIVDFGIAILREGGDSTDGPGRLTTNGLVLGTPHYMAPEQAVADPIDHRIDLFALGIMIYEMLSGKLPFDGSGVEVARANLLMDPPPIAERVPYLEVDPLLEAYANRLMAKKRDRRPATAKAARELLDLIERDRPKAAAALGVPLETAARGPQTTQPQAPVRQHSGNDTFPPPLASAPTEKQAPSMRVPMAVAASAHEPHITTAQTNAKPSRAPIIIAAIAGLGVLGGAAFVMLSGTKKHDDKVAVAAEPAKAEPAPPVEVTPAPVETKPAPVETKPAPVETKPDEMKPAEFVAAEPGSAAEPEPKTQTAKVTPKTTKTTKTTKPQTTKTETKAQPTLPPPNNVTTKVEHPVETKAEHPVQTKAEPKQATSSMVASQYQAVGSQLKALQDAKGVDAVSDLWSRYRLIRLVDAMSTQPKRDEAAALLGKLASEIAARKK